jgi:mono/diheme cytochrome c family protein
MAGCKVSMVNSGVWLLVCALAVPAGGSAGAAVIPNAQATGAQLYRTHCAPCHGRTGQGDGPDAPMFAEPPRNLREGFLDRYTTADLVRRVREGKPLELALDQPALQVRAQNVESLVAYVKQLPSRDWTEVEQGRSVYVDRCEECHGPFGKPPATLPPGVRPPRDLSSGDFQRSVGTAQLIALVRHGRKGMPALTPRIPQSDGPALAAFVRLLSPGFRLYDRNCAVCHGDDGRGQNTLAEELRMPTVSLDSTYFRTHDAEQVRAAVWHMLAEQKPAMPHYRWALSEAQAAAIVDYLKSLGGH